MDKKQNNQPQNSLGGGFLLGLLIGSLITLLFSTKRGRELLREWTEKGINKLSDLEDIMKEQEKYKSKQTEKQENDYIQKDQQQKEQERKLIAQEAEIIGEKTLINSQPQTLKKEEPKQSPVIKTPSKQESKVEVHPSWKPVEPPVDEKASEVKNDKKEEEKSKKSPIKRFFKRK